jgi:hypothetical protein
MTEMQRAAPPLPTFRRTKSAAPIEVATPIPWWTGEGSVPTRDAARACRARALLLWPRLDRPRLSRTGGDPWRIARLVAERTPRPLDEIVGMLVRDAGQPGDHGQPGDAGRSIPRRRAGARAGVQTAPRR